jgi:hypothetical protein
VRYTLQAWWCGNCRTRNEPLDRNCTKCTLPRVVHSAQVRAADRAVVYWNESTGERRVPARADSPMPTVYADQGFVRREIPSMIAYERETGVVHEASNFTPGNEPVEAPRAEAPKVSTEVMRRLIDDVRAAKASGPWTERQREAPGLD